MKSNKLLVIFILASILGCLPFVFQYEKAEANRVANNTGSVALVGALDAYTRPLLCWSLRREFSAYTGPLVRLRRASDNAESDFTTATGSYWIDVSAIESWASGSNIYIVKFYNLGTLGSTYDIFQSVAARQYVLGASGTVYTIGANSKPYFSKTGYQYTTSGGSSDFDFLIGSDITVVSAIECNGKSFGNPHGFGPRINATTGGVFAFNLTNVNRLNIYVDDQGTDILGGFVSANGATSGNIYGAAWVWDYGSGFSGFCLGVKQVQAPDSDTYTATTWEPGTSATFGATNTEYHGNGMVWDSIQSDADLLAIIANIQSDWGS